MPQFDLSPTQLEIDLVDKIREVDERVAVSLHFLDLRIAVTLPEINLVR